MGSSAFRKAIKQWEGLAEKDPFWAVCTHPDKKGDRWTVEEFFASGQQEVDILFRELDLDSLLPDRERCLDFGCGPGRITHALSACFQEVTGIDASRRMVELACELNRDENIRYIHHAGPHFDIFPPASFSMVISTLVLQHIPRAQGMTVLASLMKVLKPGGILVFQVPVADLRGISFFLRMREWVRPTSRLASLGIGKRYHMMMTVYKRDEIMQLVVKAGGILLEERFTNHTDPACAGNLRFIKEDESVNYLSPVFVVRR